jgi:pimeloyl-ACP methyl ester carboxylesterase
LPLLGRLALAPGVGALARVAPRPLVRIGLEAARGRRGTVRPELCDRATRNLRDPEGRRSFFAALRALYGEDLRAMQELYPGIRRPSLVLHGTRDPLIPAGHAKRLAGALPEGRLILLAGFGHFAQEEGPEEVAAALREFVHRQEG